MALTDLQRAVCRLLAEERIRSGESYAAEEIGALAFAGSPPDPAELSRQWHQALDPARRAATFAVKGGDAEP